MKVIEYGYLKIIKCPTCKSILQYDLRKDVQKKKIAETEFLILDPKLYYYIICPICNHEINTTDEVNKNIYEGN